MVTLQLLGGCALVADGAVVTGPASQRRRLALLAVVSSSPSGVSRDKLVAYFWPDDDRERSRRFLADSLFTLRKSLGKDALLTAGDDIRINPEVIESDAQTFDRLAAAGELVQAVALYRGPFLDGFFISDAPEFERWTERERDRLARRVAWCLEQLASQHEAAGDWPKAADEWRRLATHDPYNSRVALRAMRALDASADVAGALQHARTHESVVRSALGLECDPAVVALAERLRSRATPTPPPELAVPISAPVSFPAAAIEPAVAPAPVAARPRRLTPNRIAIGAMAVVVAALLGLANRQNESRAFAAGPVSPSATRTSSAASGDIRSRRDEARDLTAQGRYTLTKGQFDPEIHRRALELFEQAADRDSTFARAYAGMADVYNHADDAARAKEAALRAIALDSSLAEAYTALSYVLANYEYRWAEADSALQHAIRLDPRYVLAHLRRANVLAALGRLGEAEAEVERAREIQPESFVVLLNRGLMAELAGRFDEAIERFQDALELEPRRLDARYMLTGAYWVVGRYGEAQGVMRSIGNVAGVRVMSGNPDTMAAVAPLLAATGHPDSMSLAAGIYARLGRRDEAFDVLERMFEKRNKHLPMHLQAQQFAPLRDDPRYAALLRKMNLPVPAAR